MNKNKPENEIVYRLEDIYVSETQEKEEEQEDE